MPPLSIPTISTPLANPGRPILTLRIFKDNNGNIVLSSYDDSGSETHDLVIDKNRVVHQVIAGRLNLAPELITFCGSYDNVSYNV
jgi:hypothetical protein